MTACNWTPGKLSYCEGIPTACKSVPRPACTAQAGCQVTAAVCTGTPTPCASLTGAACASQPGCAWSGGAVGTGGTGGTTPVKLPDLVVAQLIAGPAQNQGQDVFPFGLTETTRGVVDAAPHSVAVVLSPDNVIGDQNDLPLWTLTVTGPESPFGIGSAVWAPAYYLLTQLIAAVPASGYYYPGVVLDSKNEVTESEETNNTAVGSRMFIGTPSYDLAAVAVASGATSTLSPGDPWSVLVTVQNKSNIDVSSIPISLLLSSDTAIDANDLRFCSTTSTTTLAAGAQAVITVPCTVPRLRGAYHLGAVLDPANVLAETDETNNSVLATGTVTIAAPSPDLTASGAATDLTDVPFAGNVTFSADAHNVGVDAAGPFNVGFYLSLTPTLAANTPLICQVALPSGLAAGATNHVSKSCTIPAMDSGAWYVIATADDRDDVFETDETNNTSVAAATITVAQPTWDLGSSLLSDNGGQNLSAGQNITFQLTVSNTGPDTIPGFDASVMLSTDMSITSSDHLPLYGHAGGSAGAVAGRVHRQLHDPEPAGRHLLHRRHPRSAGRPPGDGRDQQHQRRHRAAPACQLVERRDSAGPPARPTPRRSSPVRARPSPASNRARARHFCVGKASTYPVRLLAPSAFHRARPRPTGRGDLMARNARVYGRSHSRSGIVAAEENPGRIVAIREGNTSLLARPSGPS